jgi:hypothetical protein
VAADVMALQPRGVNGGFRPFVDQAGGVCPTDNRGQELVKRPFFRRRSSA